MGSAGRDGTIFSIRAVVVKRFQANNSNFCRSRARASLRDQPLALPAWDQQEETEQSDSRTDRGRAIDTRVQSELSERLRLDRPFAVERHRRGRVVENQPQLLPAPSHSG